MNRYTQNFYAYFGGKQIYSGTGAYLTKEEGHDQAKAIYAKLAKTGSYGYLVVCITSKYPTECYDGKSFGPQPQPPAPKCPPGQALDAGGKCQPILPFVPGKQCPAGQAYDKVKGRCVPVLPSVPPHAPQPKPTTPGPTAPSIPTPIRPPRQVAGPLPTVPPGRPGREPQVLPMVPPERQTPYGFGPFAMAPPHPRVSGVRWLGELPPDQIMQAKGMLVCWSRGEGKDAAPLEDYGDKLEDAASTWTARDGLVLMAFTTWWTKVKNLAPPLDSTTVLDDKNFAALKSRGVTLVGGLCLKSTSPGQPKQPGGGASQVNPPNVVEDAISCAKKCEQLASLAERLKCSADCVQKYGTTPPPTLPAEPSAPPSKTPAPQAPAQPPKQPAQPAPGTITKVEEKPFPWGWVIAGGVVVGLGALAYAASRSVGAGIGEPGARSNPATRKYLVRFVHNIAPKDTDVMGPVDIPDGAFSNRSTLAKALRDARVLPSGGRVRDFRVEGDKVIAFPMKSIWWSITLTPWTPAGGVREALGLDSVDRVHSNPVPFKNIYWRDIKPEDRVELRGHVYVVTQPNGKERVAYWDGQEAREAQRQLDQLVARGGGAKDNPKGSRRLGTIGDVRPVDYGGGVIYRNEYGTRVEYTYGLDGGDTPEYMKVYSVDVPTDVFSELTWVDAENVANSVGVTTQLLRARGKSRSLQERVSVIEDIAGYYGWHELDNYPLTMTEKDLRRRWRSY